MAFQPARFNKNAAAALYRESKSDAGRVPRGWLALCGRVRARARSTPSDSSCGRAWHDSQALVILPRRLFCGLRPEIAAHNKVLNNGRSRIALDASGEGRLDFRHLPFLWDSGTIRPQVGRLHAQFVKDVRARMQELGISQRELAAKLKTSQPQIARLLSGKQALKLDTVERIAKVLGCVTTITTKAS